MPAGTNHLEYYIRSILAISLSPPPSITWNKAPENCERSSTTRHITRQLACDANSSSCFSLSSRLSGTCYSHCQSKQPIRERDEFTFTITITIIIQYRLRLRPGDRGMPAQSLERQPPPLPPPPQPCRLLLLLFYPTASISLAFLEWNAQV